jgi:uncharacterized LabA/DUF88 family protein
MNLQEFKNTEIKKKLGIDDDKFGKIFIFIDFANVDRWFANDVFDWDGQLLGNGNRLSIDLEKLRDFTASFSSQTRFYYGHDSRRENSLRFLGKTKYIFGESLVFTKEIQQIRHYLQDNEKQINTRRIQHDNDGDYIYLPKCNFDVEICVDAIRLMNKYDTFCLFSSDADFISLMKYLKNNRKKVILVKGGHVQHALKANSDLTISAQDIKLNIARITQKSSL